MTQDTKAFCQVQTDNDVLNQEAQGESFTTSGYLNHGKMEEGKKTHQQCYVAKRFYRDGRRLEENMERH